MTSASPPKIFPFHLLPPEILDTILLLASLNDPPRPGVYDHDRRVFYNAHKPDHTGRLSNESIWRPVLERGSLGFIRLTHVCRRWRDVILERKSLWAENMGRLPMGDSEMFARSGSWSPFDVTVAAAPFHRTDSAALHLFKPLGPQPSPSSIRDRLRSLHIVDMREAFGGHMPLDELFSIVLFGLEELSINFLGPADEPVWFAGDSTKFVEAPNLRTLKLVNGFVWWRSSKLTSFSLNCYNGPLPRRDLLMQFMDNLKDTIEELELLYVFVRDFGTEAQAQLSPPPEASVTAAQGQQPPPPPPKITFPRLRTLHVADDNDNAAGFLLRASPPPSAHITVELYVEIEDGQWASENQKAEIERNIQAALLCGKFGPTLNGLVLRAGTKKDELVVDLYTDSLALYDVPSHPKPTPTTITTTPECSPFSVDRTPSLTFSILNASSFRLRDLDTAFLFVASILSPARFTTMSIDIPHWRPKEIEECMKLFINLRALRVVDPLDRRNLPRVPDTPLPYLSALRAIDEESTGGHGAMPLERVWIVQRERLYDFSYLSWALILSRQLRATFARGDGAPFKLKCLGVEYLVEFTKEDIREIVRGRQKPKDLFEEFAEVIEWKEGSSELETERASSKGKEKGGKSY
ncbi:unnamed protein product [Peniophora sp. CBMAI 1063]|nr:unnamed protein product [Peniophora sp. CBMAI 1063]